MTRSILALASCALALGSSFAAAAPTADPVLAAALRTERVGSTRVAARGTESNSGQSFTYTATGVLSGGAARLTYHFPESAVGPRLRTMDLVLRIEGRRNVGYFRYRGVPMPGGKRWIRIDFRRDAERLGSDMSQLIFEDDSALLRYRASTAKIGRETVLGRPTTRYRVRIDLGLAARRDARLGAAYRALMVENGGPIMREDVWIDRPGYVRRIRQTIGIDVCTVDYVSFARAVSIAAPPHSQVLELSEIR